MNTLKDRRDTFEGAIELEAENLLYSAYGRAVAYAQGVERVLQSVITLVYDKKPHEINDNTLKELLELPNEESLGDLIYKLKSKVRIGSLEKELYDCLRKRNFLIHEYFWKRSEEMKTSEGKIKMVTELADCANSFALVGKRLENIIYKWTLQTIAGDKDIEPFLIKSKLFDILESDK